MSMFDRDTIIRLAREAARQPDRAYAQDEQEFLADFAELVAAEAVAKEREECAKVGDELAANWWNLRGQVNHGNERRHLHSKVHGAEQVAAAIRARRAS
ncbi:hypothetical protein AVMA1855_20115 [Acidovorax sp. SUPP1855]|uniref:hypothetical protein n=1 Tax=Acidovorax sp. SUPP1855 TaxID=431774 RepID=UPI0023DE318C|nr:hypothetical protein [Acidovorax sp. SUPP1855]GKS86497.1 hypothetical protein AVMA1855_20115 [Acidovorax sp. SUPP1855]